MVAGANDMRATNLEEADREDASSFVLNDRAPTHHVLGPIRSQGECELQRFAPIEHDDRELTSLTGQMLAQQLGKFVLRWDMQPATRQRQTDRQAARLIWNVRVTSEEDPICQSLRKLRLKRCHRRTPVEAHLVWAPLTRARDVDNLGVGGGQRRNLRRAADAE